MTAPELPSGLYRIIVAEPTAIISGGGSIQEPKCLTALGGGSVTLSPPNAEDAPKQQWRIRPAEDGNIIIHRPSELSFPLPYLTYAGEKPEPGDQIVVKGTDLPPNEWRAEIGSECFYLIGVAGTDLRIAISPPDINPPQLELTRGDPLQFVFDREPEV